MKFVFKFLTIMLCGVPVCFAAPKVVVSIQPIHSLVSSVMEDVASPTLLLPPWSSPHDFEMRPSDAQKLADADLIIWVGDALETFLEKPITSLSKPEKVLTLTSLTTLDLLPYGNVSTDEHHDHDHDHDHHHAEGPAHHHDHQGLDPHFWLDPHRTKSAVLAIQNRLVEMDPDNALKYQTNTRKLIERLDILSTTLEQILNPVSRDPFLVFHDGYQYFNAAFHLDSRGALIDNPHAPFSLYRIKMIKEKINTLHIQCVFGEPDTNKKLLKQIVDGTSARSGILDPLGAKLEPGSKAYFEMMTDLSMNLKTCLQGKIEEEPKKP